MRRSYLVFYFLTVHVFCIAQTETENISLVLKSGVNNRIVLYSPVHGTFRSLGHKLTNAYGLSYKKAVNKKWGLDLELIYAEKGIRKYVTITQFQPTHDDLFVETFEPSVLLPISITRKYTKIYWSAGPSVRYKFKGYSYSSQDDSLRRKKYDTFISHFELGTQFKMACILMDTDKAFYYIEPFVHTDLASYNSQLITTFGIGFGFGL